MAIKFYISSFCKQSKEAGKLLIPALLPNSIAVSNWKNQIHVQDHSFKKEWNASFSFFTSIEQKNMIERDEIDAKCQPPIYNENP